MSIDKFEEWIPFNKNKEATNDDIRKYHSDWIEKYPELRVFKLTSDYYKNSKEWLYSLNKETDNINIDLFLKITKNDNWDIEYEMVLESDTSLSIQDEKHYSKSDLDYEELNHEIRKIAEYLRTWNQSIHKEYDFYPLID